MHALKPAELPAHPDLASQQSGGTQPELAALVANILAEAETFMTSFLPTKFKVKSNAKQSPPSTASVELLSHELNAVLPPTGDGKKGETVAETWFARTSVHENAAKSGTASWQEFDAGLRQDHSQREMDYTPDVHDANLVLDWATQLAAQQRAVGGWEDVQVQIREMLHHIPPPLNNRSFSVLVVTARQDRRFLVVQIPVDLSGVSNAKYVDAPKVTEGIYVSIERGELLEGDAKVKWQMATASDARGSLPMWVQKTGVASAVVKDVGLFIDWCSKTRSSTA